MSSLTIVADRILKNIDTDAVAPINGAKVALTDGTDYLLQHAMVDEDGVEWTVGMHHYACIVQLPSEPNNPAKLLRARQAAILIMPGLEPIDYKPAAGVTGYIWSPYGPVAVSINPSP